MEDQFQNPTRKFVLCYRSCLVHRLSPLTSLICHHGKELQMASLLLSQAINVSPETFLLLQSGNRKESGKLLHQKSFICKAMPTCGDLEDKVHAKEALPLRNQTKRTLYQHRQL
ncbi:hypothetical protein HAX54_012957 [Datura stramonium]|uniref:Uncharacterized protein n=1 Tax=Datura stramonium TaxID=4076 RepID=A0ABS8TMD7_DATST|nr:hypothetical protein [Datura stramonium]